MKDVDYRLTSDTWTAKKTNSWVLEQASVNKNLRTSNCEK